MKPDNLNERRNIADIPVLEIYEAIASASDRTGAETAVRQSKPSASITYSQLIEEASFMSRNIPFEGHPVEIDMSPGIGAVVALVASLKRGCRPVSNDRSSKVKLIINDNIVRITGTPPKQNTFVKYMVKGMTSVHFSRPEFEFEHRRQLRRQDFIDRLILTLMKGGKIIVRNKD